MVKNIRISDFDYNLPDHLIARHPLAVRDACRLLVSRKHGEALDVPFFHLPDFIPSNSILVRNNTKVINARMKFEKSTGSKIEIFLLEPIAPNDYALVFQSRQSCRWSCLVGNLKRWKDHSLTKNLSIDGTDVSLSASRIAPLDGNAHEIDFSWDNDNVTFASIVEAAGYIPIPPYLKRDSENSDAVDYQTVYAKIQGSVAAPTAGLHFTPALFDALRSENVDILPVTLHVGAGTFQPVKSEKIGGHPMHTEVFTIDKALVVAILDALQTGRQITAVGTTSVRTLESIPYLGIHLLQGREDMSVDQWEAYSKTSNDNSFETADALKALLQYFEINRIDAVTASTSIMIAPGFNWRIVDAMVTNFHQPQSTLLLLVSSFLGNDSDGQPRWRKLYDKAVADGFRFLSYGDACYFERQK